MFTSVIAGTGSCIPDLRVPNQDFMRSVFYDKSGALFDSSNERIISKFREITGIDERRYAGPGQRASDLGFLAASSALENSGIDRETLDYIIVAHNFGDVAHESNRVDIVPSLASRIKQSLGIRNRRCVAYDVAFGCPGWLEGVIQANYYIRSGDAKRCLVIGTETLSRVTDPHDRDTMLYSDGSGAIIMEASAPGNGGVLGHISETHAVDHAMLLAMQGSYNPQLHEQKNIYLKMNGRKLYEFAITHVPEVVSELLARTGTRLSEVAKILIHQANEKMDAAIVERVFKMNGETTVPSGIMPMIISWLGNNSVATIPILLDMIVRGKVSGQTLAAHDKIIFASVGAGMNINALIYEVPANHRAQDVSR